MFLKRTKDISLLDNISTVLLGIHEYGPCHELEEAQ
jgi:hypothetical protein